MSRPGGPLDSIKLYTSKDCVEGEKASGAKKGAIGQTPPPPLLKLGLYLNAHCVEWCCYVKILVTLYA